MAKIKSFTDIEQSRKLAEILPLESADMCYVEEEELQGYHMETVYTETLHTPYHDKKCIPCWSLAALLKLIPDFNMFKRTIECKIETTNHSIYKTCDLVDAAFEMIIKLNKLNLL